VPLATRGAELVFSDLPGAHGSAAGTAVGTTLNGGAQVLGQIFNGSATATDIGGGGTQVVFNGLAAASEVVSGTLVDWGLGINAVTHQFFAGSSLAATVSKGGFIFDVGPAAVDGDSTLNGGGEFVIDNATAFGTSVNSGSVLTLTGSAATGFNLSSTETDATINRGGIEVISALAVDFNATVRGTQFVESGGVAQGADVQAGGNPSYLSGGEVLITTLECGSVDFTCCAG
jgi:hypothetical protein